MSELARLLEMRAEALMQRWVEHVQEALATGAPCGPEPRDSMRELLRELMTALRRGMAPAASAVARQHGRQLHRLGLGREGLVREYGLLRGLVLDAIEASTYPLSLAEVRVLTDFFSTAMAEGVSEHTRQQERAAQGSSDRHQLKREELLADRLRESEERMRLATQASRVGVWELDLTTLKAWRSALHDRAFGYDSLLPEWTLDVFLAHIHPEDRERVHAELQRAMEKHGEFDVDFRVRWPDGTLHWMTASGRVEKDGSGRPTRMVGTNTDITDRKLREAEGQDRADFERQLIGIVSHDLRNPLSTVVLGAASLLRREAVDERNTKALLRIQSAAERAVRLVKDLLDFTQARLGSGIPVQRKPLDLHAFTRQVVEEIQANFPERDLEVDTQGDGQGFWDPDRLAQVLTNLLSNALKYSPPELPVTVHTRGGPGWVELEVHNGGAPIPADALRRLFQPMQRASSQTDPSGRSVGLGLYIVKHIVDAHSGTIDMKSTEAGGTTCTVHLPRDAP